MKNKSIYALTNCNLFKLTDFDDFKSIKESSLSDKIQINYIGSNAEIEYFMSEKDRVYGLGESVGGLNKRGKIYELYNIDTTNHCPSTKSMYSSHPFIIVTGIKTFGLVVNYPSKIIFDIGFSKEDLLKINIPSKNFDFYLIEGETPIDVVKEYLNLVGKPFVPPKWAFGYQQSRWSYPTKEKVEDVAKNFRSKEIPCDAIYLDLDYMDNYKVFTTSDERFSNFESSVKDMKSKGFNLVPIIDPGVKIEKGYNAYESGIDTDVFCKDSNGNNFIGAVWPGYVHFPDFLNEKTQRWWGNMYKDFVRMGINSFWNDMNEPSIFYTPESLERVKKSLKGIDKKIGIETLIQLSELERVLHGEELYNKFYHKVNGKKVNHNEVHNLYGFYMAKSTAEGLKKFSNKRYFLLSRSSYLGAHTFTGIWTGDNKSWWKHLELNIKMLISLNMVGFFYNGADIGGFGDDCSSELMIRWMQLGVFSPLFRNHSAIDTKSQEPWSFGEKTERILKEIIKIRYALIPYLYSEYMKSVSNLTPLIRPLFFDYQDEITFEIENQFMYGESVMVAPVYEPQKNGRVVYFPEHDWLEVRMKTFDDKEVEIIKSGYHYIKMDLKGITFFMKQDSVIVLEKPNNYVGEEKTVTLNFIGFVKDKAEYLYYDDTGEDYEFEKGDYTKIKISVKRVKDDYIVDIKKEGNYDSPLKTLNFEIFDEKLKVFKCTKTLI